MKRFILFTVLLSLSTLAFSQLSFGPRFGVSSSKVKIDDIESAGQQVQTGDAELGIHAGLFARIKVVNIYVQPEALFSFSGGNVTFTDVSTSTQEVAEYEFKKIDIPVMVGLSFLKVARVNAGPVFSAMLDAKQIIASQEIDFTDAYNNLTVGFQAGVGVDLWKIIVDLKYEGNLSRLGEKVDTFGFQTDQRNNQFVLSVGFKII